MILPATGLEKYEILRELATSDFAATYKAVLRGTQKTVAVHALKPSPATATDATVILRAAIAARALNSPYIVHVVEASESDGTIYVVTDYAEGSLLSTALEKADLSDWDIADLARQVCSALDHAASLNVSHPNLHPGNIIQEWDGTVKVMDYGLTVNALHRASLLPDCHSELSDCHSEERSEEPLPSRQPCSTAIPYLSPEQTRGLAPDRRSNIFSFGVILYEFVTGKKPFSGIETSDLLDQIANATPPPPHAVKRGIHPGLSPILLKALAKSPAERYQTGAELLHDLDHYKDNAAPAPKPVVPVTAFKPVPPIPSAPTQTAPLAPPPPPSPTSPISAKPAPRPAAPTPPRPSAPVAVPRPARMPVAPASGLIPTPASEFIIVGKPFNPDEAPAPTPVQPPSTPAPAKTAAPVSAPKSSPAARSPKKNNVLVLVAVSVSSLVLLCLAVAGFVLFRNRTKPAPSNPQQLAAVQPAPATQPSELEPQDTSNPTPDVPRKKKSAAPVVAAAPVPILGNLDISSTPDGASIELDGKPIQGLTPHLAPGLQPGSHTIRITKPGYDSFAQTINIEAGQTARAHAQLTESRATVSLNSDPEGALISINGEKSNRSTPATVALLKGKYIVALSKPGYLPSETILEVAPGQSYKLSPHLSPLGNADAIKETGKFKKLFGGGDRMDQMGKVQFRTNPKGATVTVNGKPMKKTTPMELFFPGGNYELVISLRGYKTVHKTITVTENAAQSIDLQLERE